ncbi:hypothetical protein, partial [Lactiplantibacillus plantarum]|uniref:hypothetical protein n=1 Tax=Lactiplantibacillus plantarum TaxID=1590 RepID=UPI001E31DDF7
KDQLLKNGFVVNTILKEADLFCPNSVRINFTIYLQFKIGFWLKVFDELIFFDKPYPKLQSALHME